ncbi:multicopper oxidase family protein [Paenibacillus sp. SYP-B3998]|uniref:Multicopper oxidase family protein n=1 Tax=Paenibacillus sp. SYP-B3998 TaxID=2678564 RepID=A0A6G4A2Q5_9BACL|nr:multicopper oxidase family protein [Paenibacillus sp. SYP-B3998]NEW08610.1 multicopper oxidase family protein [Paenibacillus sp. SYP-B3998]
MKLNTLIKLVVLTGALAAILSACTSGNGMKGMDHSKMGQTMNTQSSTPEGTPTGNVETLTGKEFNLTAMAATLDTGSGKIIPVWSFNNSVPGPQIRVKKGDVVKVNLKNELPEPVSIHWHGIPVPNHMDGIPGITQNAVQPGQTFTYEFKADDPGTYWYHSHQDSVNQVDRGLYGSIIVEDDIQTDRDYTLVLDEWNSSGMSMPSTSKMDMSTMDHSKMNMDNSKNTSTPTTAAASHDMNSMYDLFTINGKTGEKFNKLLVKKDEKVRIRLINAGFMSHKLHIHGQEFKVISTDGQLINNPSVITDQLIAIAPGERYDVEFVANNPGQWYIEEHGKEAAVKGMKAMIQYEGIDASKDQANETAELPTLDIAKYGQASQAKFSLNQKYDLEYTMDFNTKEQKGEAVYTINDKLYPNTEMLKVNKGDLVKVKFVNNSKSDDHPMHLHGHFFQVLSKNGKPLEGSPIIKDTLNVKPGEEYEVAFEADNPGDWMFHCHDLHHASAGMVTHLLYNNFKPNFVPDPKAGNKPE